ncbi:MAG: hypothetical protein K0R47_36 [Brevibacillus sp.]|nr:hypothetical protein [Brevibacillus sp.]
MIYLISRIITQGRMAGVISLCGVMLGFVVYIFATMFEQRWLHGWRWMVVKAR